MRRVIVGLVLGALVARSVRPAARGGLLSRGVRTARPARLLFHALDHLYDLGLGRLLGHRFLRLTHRGRRSGRLHHTVLEVISYEPRTAESVVVSAWGDHADWYRNIQATPALEVLTAGQRYRPTQRLLDRDELYTRLHGYAVRHRWIRPLVTRAIGLRLDDSVADRATLAARGYLGVAFRPA